MKVTKELMDLETELSQLKDHEGKKNLAAKIVAGNFKYNQGSVPSNAEMNAHFLTKFYSHVDVSIDNDSKHAKELSFFQYLNKALFSKYKGHDPSHYFDKAEELKKALSNPFINAQYKYAKSLGGETLKNKLCSDMCAEAVSRALERNQGRSVGIIGTGLSLSETVGDKKNQLDCMGRCQFVLYQMENYPNAAMSLGYYIISKTPDDKELRMWSHYHNGNIWLTFGDANKAKGEFETALALAEDANYHYAAMIMHERIGVALVAGNDLDEAWQSYEKSLQTGEDHGVRPLLLVRNQMRCAIGKGNILNRRAERQSGEQKTETCKQAEYAYTQAYEIANALSSSANEATALHNLGDLFLLLQGQDSEDFATYYELSGRAAQ